MNIKSKFRGKRGVILAIALLLVSLAAIFSLLMARTLSDHQKLNHRRHELSRALYAAETGVAHVIHSGNFASDYSLNPSLFQYSPPNMFFLVGNPLSTSQTGSIRSNYPNLTALIQANGGSYVITSNMLKQMNFSDMNSQHGYLVSNVQQVTLSLAATNSPINPGGLDVLSVGQAPGGVTRNVLAHVNLRPFHNIQILAALISLKAAGIKGNLKVHWGEAWSKDVFGLESRPNMAYLDKTDSTFDRWARYRTEATFDFPGSWKVGPDPVSDDLYDSSAAQPGLFPVTDGSDSGRYADGFYQNTPEGVLKWPEFLHYDRSAADYQLYNDFKEFAISRGRYYSTNASGGIFRDGIEDAAHRVDFASEFEIPDRNSAPYDFSFIDTVDGNPPQPDGSNLATLSISGNGLGLKGFYYLCANFNCSGVGNPPPLASAKDPDGVARSLSGANIFLDGVLYAAGTLSMSGDSGVYGSVITELGYKGGGTPNIYYNAELAKGLIVEPGNLGSRMIVVQQKNY